MYQNHNFVVFNNQSTVLYQIYLVWYGHKKKKEAFGFLAWNYHDASLLMVFFFRLVSLDIRGTSHVDFTFRFQQEELSRYSTSAVRSENHTIRLEMTRFLIHITLPSQRDDYMTPILFHVRIYMLSWVTLQSTVPKRESISSNLFMHCVMFLFSFVFCGNSFLPGSPRKEGGEAH